ncbi:phosphoribosyltransferase-like protein [Paraburkholderia caledonica]|uniref:HD superfamily phosphohydrolase n=1 Tax=Paraburkholderia caledonica TaxID=134536 RepID=A0AB73II17_9BURK|nr:HD superfamily phosphohydrolase [Paraburkholderia caledonica]
MSADLTPAAIQQFAEDFASRHLDPYIATLQQASTHFARKEVNDAIWGTIVLTPIEVALLDSPLLQRLRYIRQLGVVHWVYPSAVHTRFEHTLGMLFHMQQLIAALNTAKKLQRTDESEIEYLFDEKQVQLLRLCALLRDVGQIAFSHVSGSAVEALSEFVTLPREFTDELAYLGRVEDRQLTEILTYYIVQSPAMHRLLSGLFSRDDITQLNFGSDPEQKAKYILEKVSLALVGRKIDERLPLMHELISGPYDVDKLDYLVRDARLAGIPSLLDIPRLVQKLTVCSMLVENLPQHIAGQVNTLQADDTAWLFGVKMSGASVLDELQLARILVFTKIYRHPKVIAIEQMIRAFVEAVSKLVSPHRLLEFLCMQADDAIVNFGRGALAEALGLNMATLSAGKTKLLTSAEAILASIRERRLWVQAFQLPGSFDPDRDGGSPSDKVDQFWENFSHPQKREAFAGRVRAEVHKILKRRGNSNVPDKTALDSMVMISVLSPIAGETQTGRAFLIQKSRPPVQFGQSMRMRGDWAEQYMAEQPRAYIFSAPELADTVYIAVERLIRDTFGVRFPGWLAEASKRGDAALLDYKRSLSPSYWKGAPFDIRPMPSQLSNQAARNSIREFDERRRSFHEPATDGKLDSLSASVPPQKRTIAWLRQFETDAHVQCALVLLDNFRFLQRKDTVDALRGFIDSHPAFRGAWIVAFGNPKDSSSLQAYFSADLGTKEIAHPITLDEFARKHTNQPLIFIDDFIGSGAQASDIIAAWFARADLRKALNEKRDELDAGTREKLTTNRVAFVFVAGWDVGIEAMTEVTKAVGMKATIYRHLGEQHIPFAEERLRSKFSNQQVKSFMDRCRVIGRDLLRSQYHPASLSPADSEKSEERALGYGNRAMLFATSVNVPTQTLTVIWRSGTTDLVEWMPLLRRRTKT